MEQHREEDVAEGQREEAGSPNRSVSVAARDSVLPFLKLTLSNTTWNNEGKRHWLLKPRKVAMIEEKSKYNDHK